MTHAQVHASPLAALALAEIASAADVIVSRGGDTLAHEHVGSAPDDRFLLFSLSKPLTAVAVLVLVDAGMLKLDTRIAALIPAFAAGGKEDITVEDVLTHRGGFQEEPHDLGLADFADRERALAAICALPRRPQLAGIAAYHPLSYSILADVVEHASRETFTRFCRQQIFSPLEMAHTTWGLPAELRPSSVGFVGPGAEEWDDPAVRGGLLAAGNAWSTAHDVHRFFLMLRAGGTLDGVRILRDKTVTDMTTPRAVANGQAGARSFGYGLFVGSEPGALSGRGSTASPRCFGHAGFTATQAWYDPADDIALVVLTNSCVDQDASDLRFQTLSDEVRLRYR